MAKAPWFEFLKDKHLLWVAHEWNNYAPELAEFAMERLVNRRDVWSQYTVSKGEVRVVMLPIPERRKLGTDMVTIDKLKRHFSGKQVGHLIGLHSISDHSTAKWFAIDIDLHDEKAVNAGELARANFNAAMEWATRIQADGLDPWLMDSNGVGGYHVWTLLDKEYPLADVYDYANEIRSDYLDFGLIKKPEIFPPRREVDPDSLPYTLRLPGRHPRRPHYNRFWNFDPLGEIQWLEAGEAIEVMLATIPGQLPKSAQKRPTKMREVPKKPPKKKAPPKAKKNRVALDLDGVLAEYHGWEGSDHIGPPLPGALEFAKSIANLADIVIFTSRCAEEAGADSEFIQTMNAGQMRVNIINWLEKHGFPFVDVYVGQGKPRVSAFIDDRAVVCSPQYDEDAYAEAEKNLRALLKRKPLKATVREPKFNLHRGKVE
ncbi:MAG TPA: hypothetical protein VFZ49_00925 [Pyrinomonadaceae bacterium]